MPFGHGFAIPGACPRPSDPVLRPVRSKRVPLMAHLGGTGGHPLAPPMHLAIGTPILSMVQETGGRAMTWA